MAISEKALREFQEALGVENVSADPVVIESYSYMNSMFSVMIGNWWVKPVAVALPSTTEECQEIIEICRKHDLKFKPHGGAWFLSALACCDDCVVVDMRRMNKINEINKTDGYVVCETYVPGGEMQAEVMKEGYNCHLCGAGPNLMQLVTATSMQGSGGEAQSMSFQERNLLGAELACANGDLLYFGSPGTPNAGWFSGDGPGPSLKGMMRGAMGNMGSQGIYTRCALKLYPWYSEPYDCHGSPPFYESERPSNYNLRVVWWDNADVEAEALYRLSEAELVDFAARIGSGSYESSAAVSNEEYRELVRHRTFRDKFKRGPWTFSVVAASERGLEYRTRALDKIIEETGGHSYDPFIDFNHTEYELVIQQAIRAAYIMKDAFLPCGAFSCNPPLTYETIDQIWKKAEEPSLRIRREWMERDGILEQDLDNIYCSIDEHGHYGHVETIYQCDYAEPKGEPTGITIKGVTEGFRLHLGNMYMSFPEDMKATVMYLQYLGKIQKMLDKDQVTDGMISGAFGMMGSLDELDELAEQVEKTKA